MYNSCFNCPIYQQYCQNSQFRGPSPFGPQPGGPFGPQMGGPFGGPPMGGGQIGGPTSPSQQSGAPTAPPPSVAPQKSQATKLSAGPQTGGGAVAYVSGGSIYPCLYKPTYLWLDNGREFWVWLTYVDNQSAAGFYWTGFNWAYFGIDLRKIDSFYC